MRKVIITRHTATVGFVRAELGAEWADAPVIASATADDVTGAAVAGNLPLHLAALAAEVWAVEFAGAPPRGAEYGLEEMRAAGARLVPYRVLNVAGMIELRVAARSDGYGPHPWCLLPLPGEKSPY